MTKLSSLKLKNIKRKRPCGAFSFVAKCRANIAGQTLLLSKWWAGGDDSLERDMELVRSLLLLIEKSEDIKDLTIPKEWDRKVVAYHLKILDQAGFVENGTQWASNEPSWLIASLTWDGHEFLDSIRDDSIWKRTKDGIKEKGLELGNIPIDLLKEYAKLQIKSLFG